MHNKCSLAPNAQYEPQNVLTTQVSFQDDLIKDEFRSTYQDNDIRLTCRNGCRGRYYRKESLEEE